MLLCCLNYNPTIATSLAPYPRKVSIIAIYDEQINNKNFFLCITSYNIYNSACARAILILYFQFLKLKYVWQ